MIEEAKAVAQRLRVVVDAEKAADTIDALVAEVERSSKSAQLFHDLFHSNNEEKSAEIKELRAEVERLKAWNGAVLDQNKDACAYMYAAEAERDQLRAEVERLTKGWADANLLAYKHAQEIERLKQVGINGLTEQKQKQQHQEHFGVE
jgi:hypothetical protein